MASSFQLPILHAMHRPCSRLRSNGCDNRRIELSKITASTTEATRYNIAQGL